MGSKWRSSNYKIWSDSKLVNLKYSYHSCFWRGDMSMSLYYIYHFSAPLEWRKFWKTLPNGRQGPFHSQCHIYRCPVGAEDWILYAFKWTGKRRCRIVLRKTVYKIKVSLICITVHFKICAYVILCCVVVIATGCTNFLQEASKEK